MAGKSKAEFEDEERRRLLAEDEHLQSAVGGGSMAPRPAQPAPVRPVQRQAAHDANIVAKLIELGFDPLALPLPPKRGARSPAKQPTRAALGLSVDVMNKAWQRLRAEKRIKDADR